MIVTYKYRLLPAKRQHRALEQILESQRHWRRSDPEATVLPVRLQRATLKRLDEVR